MRISRLLWLPLSLLAVSAVAQPTNVWLKRANFTSGSGDRIMALKRVGTDSLIVARARWASAATEIIGGFVNLTRYDAAGNETWTRDYIQPGGTGPYKAVMAANPAGDLVVVLDPNYNPLGSTPNDVVVQKFRGSDGAPIWTKVLDTTENYFGSDVIGVAFDPAGNVLIGGASYQGDNQVFRIVKLHGTSASQMWVANGSSAGLTRMNVSAFAVDSFGNPALTGSAIADSCAQSDTRKAITMRFSGVNGSKTWEQLYSLANKGDTGLDLVFDSTNALIVGFGARQADSKIAPTLRKYAGATGAPAWTKTIPATGSDVWTLDDIELGPSNSIFMFGEKNTATTDSVYGAKFAANGGQQFIGILPPATGKALTMEPGHVDIDPAGNPVLGLRESPTNFGNPALYFAKMNGATGSQVWYRRAGVTGFSVPSVKGLELFANGAFNAVVSDGNAVATLRYAQTIPALPTWTRKPTVTTVSREDGIAHMVQNPAGDIFTAGSSNGRWIISKYNSAGTRLFAMPFSVNNTAQTYASDMPRQIALASDGNILVVGQSSFGSRLAKFNATNGAAMWNVDIGTYGYGAEPNILAANGDGIFLVHNGSDPGVRKYSNTNGAVLWTGTWDPGADIYGTATMLTMDSAGNPIIAGYLTPNYQCGVESAQKVFAAEFNKATGATTWSYMSTPVNTGIHDPRGLKVGANGSVFILSIVPGAAPVDSRAMVTRLSAAGAQTGQWFYQPGGLGATFGANLAIDGSDPIIALGTRPASGTGYETTVIRYNGATGTQTYATKDTTNNMSLIRQNSLIATATGVYVFGWDFDLVNSNRRAVVFKLNAAGVRQWTYRYAGTASGTNEVTGLAPATTGTNLIWVGSGTGTNSGFDQVIGRITNP